MSVNGFDINGTIVKYDYNELDNAPIAVDSNGDGVFSGKLTVGAAPTNNMDVATKKYVDDNVSGASNTFIIEWNELTSTYEDFDNIVAARQAGKALVLHLSGPSGISADELWLSDYVYRVTETTSGGTTEVTKEFYFDVPLGRSGGVPTEYAIIGHYSNNTLIVAEYEPFVYTGAIPKTALASAVQTSLGKADTALQSYTETDPTVPSWAKASSKPTYTASEVGAAPAVTEVTVSTAGAVTQALDPGKLYHFTGALTSLTIALNAAGTGVIPQYHFDFDCGSTAPTVTIPNTITLPSGNTFEASKHYEVDILNNYGVVASWATS